MHIFLTGDIQVGKSTIIRQWLAAHPELRAGGFLTVWNGERNSGESSFHLVSLGGGEALTVNNRVGLRRFHQQGRQVTPYPEVFDAVGVSLLEQARACDVIVMDEIGFTENDAAAFHQAVLACLDGGTPVLGVVRDRPGVLTDKVRAHPNVRLVRVSTENREDVLRALLPWNGGDL